LRQADEAALFGAARVMRKRLLFVVNVDWFFVSHRLPIARLAQQRGYEVHLAAAFGPQLRQQLEELGIKTHPLRWSRSGAGLIELLRSCRDLIALLRSFRGDIAHLVTLKPVLLGGMTARLLGVQRVVMAIPGRGSVFSARGMRATVRRWCALAAYRLAYDPGRTRVIVQNVEDRDYFVGRGVFRSEDVVLIRGSGADVRLFREQPEARGVPVVTLASRMLREKGIADFVAAATLLRRQGEKARFVLVGDPDPGNPHSHTQAEIEQWVRAGDVEWWGFRADMHEVFRQSHIVCLPTYYGEGVPKVLIEAAASARPIVATDKPGCRDIVRDGHNGLLVPERMPAALAAAIRRLLADSELRVQMGRRGRRWVEEQFTSEIVAERTLGIYEELLS
jgi:glycosyltransferase involved in cell wall biosynthesis